MAALSQHIPEPPPGFTRTLVKIADQMIIHSRCDHFALAIICPNAETAWTEETDHRHSCPGPTAAAPEE